MADKQPSFSERRETLLRISSQIAIIAKDLRGYAEFIFSEAERMAAAERRFSERRGRDSKKASQA